MILPFGLIILATAAAAVVAYGANPDLARFGSDGVNFIMHVRRLQGPLVLISLVPCVVLIVLVILNKRRAWWLLGLAPVLALFAHRFALSEHRFFSVAEVTSDAMLRVEEVSFLRDDDWVIGIVRDGQAYAYPYSAMYATPAVVHTDRADRWLLIWSPFANLSRAWQVDRAVRGRDLEIVSMPANATLVYNRRLGEFINGITGQNQNHETPPELREAITSQRMTWSAWRSRFPDTRVMPPMGRSSRQLPAAPVKQLYAIPPGFEPRDRLVAMIPATQPAAIEMGEIRTLPLNISISGLPVVVFRDPDSGEVRAFDRRIDGDLSPKFNLNSTAGRRAWLVDSDTNSGWDARGVAVDGPCAKSKTRLRSIPIEPDVYWGSLKFWMPDLTLLR